MGKKKILYQQIRPGEWHAIREKRVIGFGDTGIQKYRILDLENYGLSLEINGSIQSTMQDLAFYHDLLIFPPFTIHRKVKKALCFGGANGGILKRLAMIPGLECVTIIDIDEALYFISKYYLPHAHPVKPLPFKLKLKFEDPIKWLENFVLKNRPGFDMVIADLPDSTKESYAKYLFTKNFYTNIKKIMYNNSIFVTQAGQANPLEAEFHSRTISTLKSVFRYTASYCNFVPSYGVPWGFAVASDGIDFKGINTETISDSLDRLPKEEILAYDLETHKHIFNLTKSFRKELKKESDIIKDNSLAIVKVVK